jgi:hypothetical protein
MKKKECKECKALLKEIEGLKADLQDEFLNCEKLVKERNEYSERLKTANYLNRLLNKNKDILNADLKRVYTTNDILLQRHINMPVLFCPRCGNVRQQDEKEMAKFDKCSLPRLCPKCLLAINQMGIEDKPGYNLAQ